METINTNGQINGGAAAREELKNIYRTIINTYLGEAVEDCGRSESNVYSKTLESNDNIELNVILKLGQKRNGFRRVKGIDFMLGIKGMGGHKLADAENFYDEFIQSDYIDELFDRLNIELPEEFVEKAVEKVYRNANSVKYGEHIFCGHEWYEFDEYDLFYNIDFPKNGIPVKLMKDIILEKAGRNGVRRALAERITQIIIDYRSELQALMHSVQERLDYNQAVDDEEELPF